SELLKKKAKTTAGGDASTTTAHDHEHGSSEDEDEEGSSEEDEYEHCCDKCDKTIGQTETLWHCNNCEDYGLCDGIVSPQHTQPHHPQHSQHHTTTYTHASLFPRIACMSLNRQQPYHDTTHTFKQVTGSYDPDNPTTATPPTPTPTPTTTTTT